MERAVARLNGRKLRKSKWNNCAILPHGVPVPRESGGNFYICWNAFSLMGIWGEAFVRCFEGVLDGSSDLLFGYDI